MYSDGCREVLAIGDPSAGGAHAKYSVVSNTGVFGEKQIGNDIVFQHDTISNIGVVGWTNECLLAIVADRLNSFQQGEFACDENQEAIDACHIALDALNRRTESRKARGVEGTHTP